MYCDDISAEKTEAINQCPWWIVFAMCGSYARGSLVWRLWWVIATGEVRTNNGIIFCWWPHPNFNVLYRTSFECNGHIHPSKICPTRQQLIPSIRWVLLYPKVLLSAPWHRQERDPISPTSDHQIFTLIEKTKPQKVLGVHTVPTNSTTYQQDILLQSSPAMGGLINANPMLPSHTHTATTQYIHPSIGFPLVPQRLTQKQIDSIQSPTSCALLGRLHMSSKMSGGVGLK